MEAEASWINPSDAPRSGIVTLDCFELVEGRTVPVLDAEVHDRNGRELISQVERLDPIDPSMSFLLVSPLGELAPGSSQGMKIKLRSIRGPDRFERQASIRLPQLGDRYEAVTLKNSQLTVEVGLGAAAEQKHPCESRCFGGAIRSVTLNNPKRGEILFGTDDSYYRKWKKGKLWLEEGDRLFQLRKMRCLQIAKLFLWDEEREVTVQSDMFDSDFTVVEHNQGPLRASVTLASQKTVEVAVGGPSQRRYLNCQLFRALSLDRGADFVMERLWVRPVQEDAPPHSPPPEKIPCRVQYLNFLCWNRIFAFQLPEQRDWFVLGAELHKFDGLSLACTIGFSNSTHTRHVRPHPFYPKPHAKECLFSWETDLPATLHKSATKFMFAKDLAEVAHSTGELWFDQVFRPLEGRRSG